MKEKWNRFMQGRYGADQLNRFLLGVALALIVIAIFIPRRYAAASVLDTAGLLIIVYAYYRIFSRDISRRYRENQKFLAKTEGIRRSLAREKNRMAQRKVYHIYTCPGCKQKIRIPRGKGKIEISCPKCGTKFIKRS